MKILLLGKNGQIGWELQRSLAPLGQVLALDAKSQNYCGDLYDLNKLAETVQNFVPQVIVNAAAYTAVDKAESEIEKAKKINTNAVSVLAREASKIGSLLVHYSTDYVFSGDGHRPWCESDIAEPLNQYGFSKLEGEQAIQASGCQHLILRTSWVYATRGNNFIKTILRLASERDSLSVIVDQFGAPTGAELLADISAHMICAVRKQSQLSGLYHAAAMGETNWYEYACFVLKQAESAGIKLNVNADQVGAIVSSAYPSIAKRPTNSRLNTNKLQQTFSLNLPFWQLGVERVINEILEQKNA